ncbi:hypothetical protein BU17DRAFT_36281 [Hysterangium stoloniferum]|nr:hypothetical protein BU17DRAFT_36281 [Hysterangium stoloniferum]
MLPPEKKISWHPTRANRFVVGGCGPIGQIKMYDWDGKSEITEVTTLGDLQHMKCFALSPHPLDTDLVAVGNSLGKVDLMRFSASHPPNSIRSSIVTPLPVRTSRACNALAFSHFDPNYLAVGLDKVRGDPSLVIWDIESALSKSGENVIKSSFPRPQPPLPRSGKFDNHVLQQWLHNEVVTSLAFLPQTTSLLIAGVSHRWIRLFDLRASQTNNNPQSTATKSVHGITTDPFDSNRFACFGDDGAVRIWDHRKFSTPLLTFTEREAIADGANPRGMSPISGMEFCSTRRGTLATLEKDSFVVRFWDTTRATVTEQRSSSTPEPTQEEVAPSKISKLARLPWTTPNTESQHLPSHGKQTVRGEQLILCNTRTCKHFLGALSSFVCIPNTHSRGNEYSVAVVTKEGDLNMQTMHDPPQPQWSSRGELSIGAGRTYQVYQPFNDEEPISDPWNVVPREQRSRKASPFSSIRGRREASKAQILSEKFPAGESSNVLNLDITNTYSSASMKRFGLDISPAPDATPRPGQLELRRDVNPADSRGKPDGNVESKPSRRSLSRGKLSLSARATRRVITDDISMVIRRRALQGYGLENVVHNASIVRAEPFHGETLSELWSWIESSRTVLSSGPSQIHGYEFANQGVLGIWEGFPPATRAPSVEPDPKFEALRHEIETSLLALRDGEGDGYRTPSRHKSHRSVRRNQSPADQLHGDFAAAVHTLNTRRGYDRATVAKIPASTSKTAQRRFCLTLCGWNQGDEELIRVASCWEKEGQLTRAACWLLFIDHQDKAIECLMRSDDERLRIMSGTIAALSGQRSTPNQSREHYNRLIVRIEDPYLRVMLTHVALEDWSEILQEESLPLRERLAIAVRFLDDRALSSYLRQLTDKFRIHGDIEGLILTGLTPLGFEVLQGYVDSTGDVQTASILAAFVCPGIFKDMRADRWLEAYHSLLDGWKLFHHRCQFDISRGKILKDAMVKEEIPSFDWVPPQLAVRCGFCKKTISSCAPMAGPSGRKRMQVNSCQSCGRSLPRCAICLTTLGLGFDLARDTELAEGPELLFSDTIDDALVFCQTCKHGGHISHMLEWFYGHAGADSQGTLHDRCPVAGCDCRCALE